MNADKLRLRRRRIKQSVTPALLGGSMLRENSNAAKALFSLVRMPQDKRGSRKAIKHWRGSSSSPLDQNPGLANLGFRVRKEGRVVRCRELQRPTVRSESRMSTDCR